MSNFSPSQTSFAAGEVSPRLWGQVDSDLYRKGLAEDTNFLPTGHGSLLNRSGSKLLATQAASRLIPFNVSGADPYILALSDLELRIYSRYGAQQTFLTNLVTNGTFDAGSQGWTGFNSERTWQPGGYVRFSGSGLSGIYQTVPIVSGRTYVCKFRARADVAGTQMDGALVGSGAPTQTVTLSTTWAAYTVSFVSTATGNADAMIASNYSAVAFCDDIFWYDTAEVAANHLDAPWSAARLAAVQYDQDLTKNRMMLVHGNVAPQLLTLNVHGYFELRAATFISAPTTWGGTNWPSIIDWGYQGRLWLGATPDQPNVVNYSKSGYPFDLTVGSLASDGYEFNASVRGSLRWMQGQKSLLMGAERVEQAVHGNGTVVTPSNIQVEEESAFGSAAIQATHLGDEVLFVGRDLKEIRALSFDAQVKNGWVSVPVSFVGAHLVYNVKELHFARRPVPTIVGLRTDGTMFACTYDRGLGVTAWWRLSHVGVTSACVIDTPDGDEVILAIPRATAVNCIESMPLHEASIEYLDSHVTRTLDGSGVASGLGHLNGLTARVMIAGAVVGDFAVSGGTVTIGVAHAGQDAVIGLAFTATAKTLPLEGGVKFGHAQSMKRRRMRVRLRLNDSAIPTVEGETPKKIDSAQGTTNYDVTGDVECVLGTNNWARDGAITITQSQPFRTEVLALFGTAEVQEF